MSDKPQTMSGLSSVPNGHRFTVNIKPCEPNSPASAIEHRANADSDSGFARLCFVQRCPKGHTKVLKLSAGLRTHPVERGQYGRVEDGSKEPLHGQGDGLRNKRKTIDVPDTKDADILNTKCGISNPARRNIPDDPCLSKLGALYRVCPQAGRQF